jgi:flagellar biosynthesis/type III secretory pathway protein FliH
MQGGDEEGIIQQWKRLVEQVTDRSLRATYAGLALVFAEKRQRGEAWRRALEGWDVEESPIVKEWQQKVLQRGLERGLEQGQQRGVAAMRQSVVRVLQAQIKEALPGDILEAIDKQNDLNELVAWVDLALQAVSPDAFRAAIRQRNGTGAPGGGK